MPETPKSFEDDRKFPFNGPQAAVGEGELPEPDIRKYFVQTERGLKERYSGASTDYQRDLSLCVDTLKAQLREAIAQRDEANRNLEQIRFLARSKETCGHATAWQCAGEGGFYCLMCRAEAAEAKLAEMDRVRSVARQDAVPETEKPQFDEHGWDGSGHTYAENHESFKGWGPINPAYLASTQPPVGEGELPELGEPTQEDLARIRTITRSGIVERAVIRERQLREERKAHKLAIAQRDEARKQAATFGIVELAIRNPNVASYVEHWEKRAVTAESKLAALDVPKPEEIERLEKAASYPTPDNGYQYAFNDGVQNLARHIREARLRSLPSEPHSYRL